MRNHARYEAVVPLEFSGPVGGEKSLVGEKSKYRGLGREDELKPEHTL